jgi:triacylglycerol lipase
MQKPAPEYRLEFVLHPEHDAGYKHFENSAGEPFQPNPKDFPRVNVWWLAEAALLTYWDKPKAIQIFRAAGCDCEFITADSTDCYVASQPHWVVVAFRGTQPDEWKDILADANILLVPWRTGLVHCGFKKAFDAIVPQLDPILQRLTPGRTLWFCGHSLGAAMATLAADHYGAGTRGVCTFGSPRVGDHAFSSAFSAKFSGKSLRYVNDHDVVTHVPPPIGYEHVDARRFIAPDGTVSSGESAIAHFFSELFGVPKQLLAVIESLRSAPDRTAPDFLLDHMPNAYAIWTWNDYDANG